MVLDEINFKLKIMDSFDAKQAKQLAKESNGKEVMEIIADIKAEAAKGKYKLYVSRYLKPETVEILQQRGFEVSDEPSIAIQKDNLYHTIKW